MGGEGFAFWRHVMSGRPLTETCVRTQDTRCTSCAVSVRMISDTAQGVRPSIVRLTVLLKRCLMPAGSVGGVAKGILYN